MRDHNSHGYSVCGYLLSPAVRKAFLTSVPLMRKVSFGYYSLSKFIAKVIEINNLFINFVVNEINGIKIEPTLPETVSHFL